MVARRCRTRAVRGRVSGDDGREAGSRLQINASAGQVRAAPAAATATAGQVRDAAAAATADQVRGAPAAATPGSDGYSGASDPPRPPPTAGVPVGGRSSHLTSSGIEGRRRPNRFDAMAAIMAAIDAADGKGSSGSSSSKEPITPELRLEIGKELIFRFTMAQGTRTLSVSEQSLVNRIKDSFPDLEAAAAAAGATVDSNYTGVPVAGLSPDLISSVLDLWQSELRGASMPASQNTPEPTASPPSEEEEQSWEEGSSWTSSSSSEEEVTPGARVQIARELIFRYAMAQHTRMLSDDEQSIFKRIKDTFPGLEAAVTTAIDDSSYSSVPGAGCSSHLNSSIEGRGQSEAPGAAMPLPLSPNMPAPASQLTEEEHRGVGRSSSPSSCEPPLTPALQLAIAEAGSLQIDASAGQVRGAPAAAPSSSGGYNSDSAPPRPPPMAGVPGAGRSSHLVSSDIEGPRRPNRFDAMAAIMAVMKAADGEGSSGSSSSSSKEPITPELRLEIGKELIFRFTMAQGTRTLSVSEQSLVNHIKDSFPDLEAAVAAAGAAVDSDYTGVPVAGLSPDFISGVLDLWQSELRGASMPASQSTPETTASPPSEEEEQSWEDGSSSSWSSSSEEEITPGARVKIARELIFRYAMAQHTRMLSDDEQSIFKRIKDMFPGLEAAVATAIDDSSNSSVPGAGCSSRLNSSIEGRGQSEAPGAAMPLPLSPDMLSPASQLAQEGEHWGVGRSSSPSSCEPPLTPALQLAIAKEVIGRLVMAQEKRMLSADEHTLIKFLEDSIPGLEAASGVCGGHHLPRRGFMVRTPLRWAWPPRRHEKLWSAGSSSSSPSSSKPLTPTLLLQIAKELINCLVMAQERRMLSVDEHSLLKHLIDLIPGFQAASRLCDGATLSPSKVAPSGHAPAKASRAVAASLSLVATLCRPGQVAMPASAHVSAGRQVVTRHLGEEDARATSVVNNHLSDGNVSHEHHRGQELSSEHESLSSLSSSTEKLLTPALQLEIAKEVISRLTMAQEKRVLSDDEHFLIKSLEDRIPGLEAASGVCGGVTPSLSKVAPSDHACVPTKASCAAPTSLSPVATLHCPGLRAPLVHPLSQQVAMPAAHVSVDRQIGTRHFGEEDAHASSGVSSKMSDVNVSHEHHGGQELSSEHESLEKRSSGCDLGIVTEKSSTTIAPEMDPPPSDGDNTSGSSCVSNRWGTAPEVEDFDDFGLPDDLGLY